MTKPKQLLLTEYMFNYEALLQVLVSIRLFRADFLLNFGLLIATVVLLKVSVVSPTRFSNVSKDFWYVIIVLDFY